MQEKRKEKKKNKSRSVKEVMESEAVSVAEGVHLMCMKGLQG